MLFFLLSPHSSWRMQCSWYSSVDKECWTHSHVLLFLRSKNNWVSASGPGRFNLKRSFVFSGDWHMIDVYHRAFSINRPCWHYLGDDLSLFQLFFSLAYIRARQYPSSITFHYYLAHEVCRGQKLMRIILSNLWYSCLMQRRRVTEGASRVDCTRMSNATNLFSMLRLLNHLYRRKSA